jgi:hypothetical protein
MPLYFQALGFEIEFGPYSSKVAVVGLFLVFWFSVFSLFSVPGKTIVVKPAISSTVFARVSTMLTTCALVYLVIDTNGLIFTLEKGKMLSMLGYSYMLWTMMMIFAMVSSIDNRRSSLILISIVSVLVNIYIGFRSPTAIIFISIVVGYCLKNHKTIRDLPNMYLLLIILGGLFFFTYKGFYLSIKMGNYDLMLERVVSIEYIAGLFVNSEPSVTLSILSNVLEDELRIGSEHIMNIIISIGIFGWVDTGAVSYNSIIQPLYYPDIAGGVGSNIWANVYSLFNYSGLFIFIFMYVFSLYWLSVLVQRVDGTYKYLLLVLGSYWAFYIHRNDLAYQVTLEKRVTLCFILIALISYVITKKKRAQID